MLSRLLFPTLRLRLSQFLLRRKRHTTTAFDAAQNSDEGVYLLNLHSARLYLHQQQIYTAEQLSQWILNHPQRHAELVNKLELLEVNASGLHILGQSSLQKARKSLLYRLPLETDGIRTQLLNACLQNQPLESQRQANLYNGQYRYLWLSMPGHSQAKDYQQIALTVRDITSHKQAELALATREKFWAQVVRTIPNLLYVLELEPTRLRFSNHSLATQLGYAPEDPVGLGDPLLSKLQHPDEHEYHLRLRNLQKVLRDGQVLEFQTRLRHRDGRWRWFSVREHALTHHANGRVAQVVGIAKDVTDQVEFSEQLRASERRHRLLAESISDLIFTTDKDFKLNYVSPSSETVLGHSADWIIGHGFTSIAQPNNQLKALQQSFHKIRTLRHTHDALRSLEQELTQQVFVINCYHRSGKMAYVELCLNLIRDEHGRFNGLLGVGRDISQQQHTTNELRLAATVFENSTAAIMLTDSHGRVMQVNHRFMQISGYKASQLQDQRPHLITADPQQAQQLNQVFEQLQQRLRNRWEGEIWLKRPNGTTYPVWFGITAVLDDHAELANFVCFFSDISERKANEQRIHRLAYFDALTQLPNRTLFQERLHHALLQNHNQLQWFSVMFLDLDRFKPINDSLGHAAGDHMLKEVARRLSTCVNEQDTVARMGGDEFTLMLSPSHDKEHALQRARNVAHRILQTLNPAFDLQGREFFVSASIGIALSNQDGNEASQLMKNADTAMYHAKACGRDNFQFYRSEMNARALERLELESDLRHALEQQELHLAFQPQYGCDGTQLCGAEVLLRWHHPTRGNVSPMEFIPVLEELGLVVQVGDWVLRQACQQLRQWDQAGLRVPKLAVNLSARQFNDGQLHLRIAQILKDTGIAAERLELELTESILMHDVNLALSVLNGFKRLGLTIAVDDFGTGYSSLNYLKQFPIDVLKIDRSFVDGLPFGERDAQIARAIIAMAHSLNLSVLAEGVENAEQLAFLRDHHCDQVQGYLLGRPLKRSAFEQHLNQNQLEPAI